MCFERGIRYQICFLKINFQVFWLLSRINLCPLGKYSLLLWHFLICGRALPSNNFRAGSKSISKRKIWEVSVVSRSGSLVGCIFLRAVASSCLKIQRLGTLETFPRDPVTCHAKEKGSSLVDQIKNRGKGRGLLKMKSHQDRCIRHCSTFSSLEARHFDLCWRVVVFNVIGSVCVEEGPVEHPGVCFFKDFQRRLLIFSLAQVGK